MAPPDVHPGDGRRAATGFEVDTRAALDRVLAILGDVPAPTPVPAAITALRSQIGHPCVVAVVGLVNAGKSTFINALLRDDKALVGTTETTATVNHFVYGDADPRRPVRCYWRSGEVTQESADFLASLQGNDHTTLQRAEGIDHLEYLMLNPILRAISVVDTPGTGAVVTEHERRTTAFLDVAQRLRQRHAAETLQIQQTADAVVHLVGAVARQGDEDLLGQFLTVGNGGASAMNALGVLARVDLDQALLERRHHLAERISTQLGGRLHTVVPVSAALDRATDVLAANGPLFDRLIGFVRQTPDEPLDVLLQNEELFDEYEPASVPLTSAERRDLKAAIGCGWGTFVTLVEEARHGGEPVEVEPRLRELAGFDVLRRTLDEHFVARAGILRCHRIVVDAQAALRKARFGPVLSARRDARREAVQLRRFIGQLDGLVTDRSTASELRGYLQARLTVAERGESLDQAWRRAEQELDHIARLLGEYNGDFQALIALRANEEEFTDEETAELTALLGTYGTTPAQRLRGDAVDLRECATAQLQWRLARDRAARGTARYVVTDRAVTRLGLLLEILELP